MPNVTTPIAPEEITVYQVLKAIARPVAEKDIVLEFEKQGTAISEWQFRASVRRLIEAGAVQKLGDYYLIRDTGGLYCRKLEERVSKEACRP